MQTGEPRLLPLAAAVAGSRTGRRTLRRMSRDRRIDPQLRIVGIIPVHVGGDMLNMDAVSKFAGEHKLWANAKARS